MLSKRGYELPEGTGVYARYELCTPFYHITKHVNDISNADPKHIFSHGQFCYYSYDKDEQIWASCNTREFWECHPQFHPHATLFGILFSKLDIKNYT
jgi:hypothetical protein